MRLIDRYICRQVFSHALLGLGIFSFVFFVPQLVRLMDLVVRHPGSWTTIASLFLSTLPGVLVFTLPIAVLVGVLIALDNFGAGHSSLSLPCTLPLDMVKVDRSLIQGFEHDRAKRAIVKAAAAIAKEIGIQAVAVGIETDRQLELVRAVGFALGQGYLLCAPDTPELLPLGSPQPVRSPLSWRSIARLGRRPRTPGMTP